MTDPFLFSIKQYLNRKNPTNRQFFNQDNSGSNNGNNSGNSNSSGSNNSSYNRDIHHHHHYNSNNNVSYAYAYPMPYYYWWNYSPPQQTTVINNNYRFMDAASTTSNKKDDDADKKDKKDGVTSGGIIAGLVMLGAVTGVGYVLINNFFDIQEEKDLYEKLKKSGYKESNPHLYNNFKPILKANMSYSKRMFMTKVVGFGSGLAFLYNIFYLDNPDVMNGLFVAMAGTTLFGMFSWISHYRHTNSDDIIYNYSNMHRILTTPTDPIPPPQYQSPQYHPPQYPPVSNPQSAPSSDSNLPPSAPQDEFGYNSYSYMNGNNIKFDDIPDNTF